MIIELKDVEFFARHGVFAEEREQGNLFRVSVSINLPDARGCLTDLIDDTLNYQLVYDLIAAEMDKPSNLLEHVAWRIKNGLADFVGQWLSLPHSTDAADTAYNNNACEGLASRISVSVSKKNPPLGGKVPWVTVRV